jgi:cytoskeletal protein CcmA (bactofilin family)|tara:strand:- start:209 stop:1480 length:1272 start_codon:yes stop_codon:yes gene_type:complete
MADLNTEFSQSATTLYIKAADGFERSTKFGAASSDVHNFTGSVYISGTLYANNYQVNTIDTSAGSTIFGNDAADTHNFTGSILAQKISASAGATLVGGLIASTLNISGATTLKSGLSSSAGATLVGGLIVSTLQVSGASTLKSALSSSAGAVFGGPLVVSNTLELSGNAILGNASSDIHQITGSLHLKDDPGAGGTVSVINIVATGLSSSVGATFVGGLIASTLKISGSITGSGIASGSAAGQGSFVGVNAQGGLILTASLGAITTVANGVDNRVATFTASDGLNGEANLTFDGSVLTVAGNVSSSGGGMFVEELTTAGTLNVSGTATFKGNISSSAAATIVGGITTSTFNLSGAITGHMLPVSDSTYNLGSASKRWANVYTGDLHLKNERGNWTIVEEEDYLCVINNITGKKFKMVLQEIED